MLPFLLLPVAYLVPLVSLPILPLLLPMVYLIPLVSLPILPHLLPVVYMFSLHIQVNLALMEGGSTVGRSSHTVEKLTHVA